MKLRYLKPRTKIYIGGRWMVRLAALVLISLVVGVVGMVAGLAYIARDLPSPDRVVRREGFSTKIYDRNGKQLYDVFENERRIPVSLTDVPEVLRQATIAIEDRNFYSHQGFDPWGIFRAAVKTVVYRRLQGGSTLTQQLVKNTLLTSSRTLSRKIKELDRKSVV